MHKSRLGTLVVDCEDGDMKGASAFWRQALGYTAAPPEPDDDGRYVTLKGPPREVTVLLQRVEHPSRVHLDIETDDLEAEAARLERLGARRIGAVKRWIVMEAPSGHRFCVVPPQRPDFEQHATVWDE